MDDGDLLAVVISTSTLNRSDLICTQSLSLDFFYVDLVELEKEERRRDSGGSSGGGPVVGWDGWEVECSGRGEYIDLKFQKYPWVWWTKI